MNVFSICTCYYDKVWFIYLNIFRYTACITMRMVPINIVLFNYVFEANLKIAATCFSHLCECAKTDDFFIFNMIRQFFTKMSWKYESEVFILKCNSISISINKDKLIKLKYTCISHEKYLRNFKMWVLGSIKSGGHFLVCLYFRISNGAHDDGHYRLCQIHSLNHPRSSLVLNNKIVSFNVILLKNNLFLFHVTA